MAKIAAYVEGVYERIPGSGIWHARYRQDGKLVRKSFGHNRAAAIAYVEKARTLKRTGEGFVPSTAKAAPKTKTELEQSVSTVTRFTTRDMLHAERTNIDYILAAKDTVNPIMSAEAASGSNPSDICDRLFTNSALLPDDNSSSHPSCWRNCLYDTGCNFSAIVI
jgi:hypothetical protein